LGPGYLFQQEEIKDLIAYLTFLTNLSDSISLFRVLSMEIFDIPYIELNYLLNFAKKNNLTLFEALLKTNQSFITDYTRTKLEKFRRMAEKHLLESKKEQAGRVLYDFLVDSGIYETLSKTDSIRDERKVQNIAKFFDRIKNFEMERSDANIFTLVDWLSLMLQMGDSPIAADIDIRDANAVNILTVHSSKGLEFKVVFMINLVNDRFPTRERSEKIPLPTQVIKEDLSSSSDFHTQEERRLFYVGMTRAKERLFFTAADYYGTGKRIKKISPFVFEALPDFRIDQVEKSAEQLTINEALSAYEYETTEANSKRLPYKLSYITYSNLQMFDICPLHYKARVILNIPSPTTSVQSFGISIHRALQEFYERMKSGEKPSKKDLLAILDEHWLSEGYENKKHEAERKLQAKKMLNVFFKKEFSPKTKVLGLELPFSFQLKNGIKIFGKIDRIDDTGSGIEIIDYKTGEENPKANKSHKLQLEMYALAASRVRNEIFNKAPNNIKLTLHFLEKNTKKSLTFSAKDLGRLEDDLIAKAKEIEGSDFKCSGSVLCLNCEYKMLCSTQF
jgi:DNA helicase-2/ATP-dependent DNA helicase PcrA